LGIFGGYSRNADNLLKDYLMDIGVLMTDYVDFREFDDNLSKILRGTKC
jgi:hypothetical protein